MDCRKPGGEQRQKGRDARILYCYPAIWGTHPVRLPFLDYALVQLKIRLAGPGRSRRLTQKVLVDIIGAGLCSRPELLLIVAGVCRPTSTATRTLVVAFSSHENEAVTEVALRKKHLSPSLDPTGMMICSLIAMHHVDLSFITKALARLRLRSPIFSARASIQAAAGLFPHHDSLPWTQKQPCLTSWISQRGKLPPSLVHQLRMCLGWSYESRNGGVCPTCRHYHPTGWECRRCRPWPDASPSRSGTAR